ncbi:FAD-dependent monooxygenase [Streptomyces sp. BV286]|uniref:NAD(P)/FAD-dependent oxidoreductase n=1 Tax=Streptomyces sp. BV286 TaxID=2849672 RepID=UPI001C2E91BB|nr:FAD-dependent monooxygenase [Streptomyces sp. BV286]MBV1940802.1 FAD-dependent monooxygenase [Streptomyces sp. BV286]
MSTAPVGLRSPHAIVIGGSLTALLAAQALSDTAHVTVIERDVLPEQPAPRKNLPQAHHVHLLWSGGADAIETLLPGTEKALAAAGARRIPLTTGMVGYSPAGWFRRWAESHYVIGCTRDLLDVVVRDQVLKSSGERITLRQGTDVIGLEGTAAAVTGVRISGTDGIEETISADMVFDASGRGSRTPHWLKELGAPEPATRAVDPGLVYASRIYQAPAELPENWPIINVQADPRGDGPGKAGVILPIEGNRWLVTLSGTRGGQPTDDPADFVDFALQLRHPIVGEILARTTPLTDVTVTRTTANRRRYYEKTAMPENLVVLGDAVAAFNPVYGHGMTVAAQSAVTLQETIQRHGWGTPRLAQRVQKAITPHVQTAWAFATGSDVFYPGATDTGPTFGERVSARFVDRLIYTATGSGRVARDLTDVVTMEAGPHTLGRPSTLIAVAIGPLKDKLEEPPFTPEELQVLNG